MALTHLPHQLSAKSLLPQNPHLPKGKVLAHGCKVWTHKISPICLGLRLRDHHLRQQHPDQDLRKKINNLIDVIGDHLVMTIIEDVIMTEDITTGIMIEVMTEEVVEATDGTMIDDIVVMIVIIENVIMIETVEIVIEVMIFLKVEFFNEESCYKFRFFKN